MKYLWPCKTLKRLRYVRNLTIQTERRRFVRKFFVDTLPHKPDEILFVFSGVEITYLNAPPLVWYFNHIHSTVYYKYYAVPI